MKKNYTTPALEAYEIFVEQGFAKSPLPDFEGTTPGVDENQD